MEVIDLGTAVDHIKQACEDDTSEHPKHPFFFLVGAGISYPPIPLSSAIVEHCKSKTAAQQHKRTIEQPGNIPIDIYSHWFQQAYPHPIQRQRYLRKLIEGKPISAANLRLAHLLLEKRLRTWWSPQILIRFFPRHWCSLVSSLLYVTTPTQWTALMRNRQTCRSSMSTEHIGFMTVATYAVKLRAVPDLQHTQHRPWRLCSTESYRAARRWLSAMEDGRETS